MRDVQDAHDEPVRTAQDLGRMGLAQPEVPGRGRVPRTQNGDKGACRVTVEADLRDATRTLERGTVMLEEATKQRDSLIRQAHAEGAPMRTIAEWAGVSHQRVGQIINES